MTDVVNSSDETTVVIVEGRVEIVTVGIQGEPGPPGADGSGGLDTTDDLPEGSSNLYFTNARVASAPGVTAKVAKAGDTMTGELDISYDYPNIKIKNGAYAQYAGAALYLLNTPVGSNQAGVGHYMAIADAGLTKGYYAIFKTNAAGAGQGDLMVFNFDTNSTYMYSHLINDGNMTLLSSNTGGLNTTDSTHRINLQSYQKAQRLADDTVTPAHFGEVIRIDLKHADAKAMIAWRDAFTDPNNPVTKAWIGYHYNANDVSDPINPHDHISIETPDAAGLLQTRIEVVATPADTTKIRVVNSDFTVAQNTNGVQNADGVAKQFGIFTSSTGRTKLPRWTVQGSADTEAGSNVGTNFKIGHFNDAGTFIQHDFRIERATGYIAIGANPATPLAHLDLTTGNAVPGMKVTNSTASVSSQPNFYSILGNVANRVLSSNLTADTTSRYVLYADGKQEWGPGGAAARDTNLYRSTADTLKTDDNLIVAAAGNAANSVVNVDATQTLSSKTMSGSNNTFSNIPQSAVTNLASDLAGKQSTLSLTTTGTSGAATLIANTLNIPQYTSGITRTIQSSSGSFSAGATANTDYVYFLTGNHVPTIPTAVGNTNRYTFVNNHSAAITFLTTSGQTIAGGALTLGPGETVDLLSNNANWFLA